MSKRARATWLDRGIGWLFPGWARRRLANRVRIRRLASYDAADKTRETEDWTGRAKTKSADQAIISDTKTLNARARDAVRNNPTAVSIVGAYRRHIIGTGIHPKAAGRDPRNGEPFADFNRAADALFTRWSQRAKYVDIERRKSFVACQRLMALDFAAVGQSFLIVSYSKRRDAVGLVLQVCEQEQLDTSITSFNGNVVRGGVEIDDYGAPIAYHIYQQKHPLESYGATSTRVAADRVCHFMEQDRARQTYGVSRLAPALKTMWHAEMYEEYMLVRARVEACICAMVTRELGLGENTISLIPSEDDDLLDAVGNTELVLEPGMVKYLRPGEDIKTLIPTTPGNQFDPFIVRQITRAAAGALLDYAAVARDYTRATYSGQREARLEREREIDPIQGIWIDLVGSYVWEEFVKAAVLEKRLTPPARYWTDEDTYQACLSAIWAPPAKITIDPQKDAVASKIRLEKGLTNLKRELASLGLDWEEVIHQLAEEADLIRELNLEFLLPQPKGATAPAAAPKAPPAKQNKPGDNGGKQRDLLADRLMR